MTMISDLSPESIGGVDTHRDVHVAGVIDHVGRVLGTHEFPTTTTGYQQLLRWLRSHPNFHRVGVEGTSSYGRGLTRVLLDAGIEVLEVTRPNRQRRRRYAKSDTTDAIAAAVAVLNGEATAHAKTGAGTVECLRVVNTARNSALKARTAAINQFKQLLVTAPDQVRSQLRDLDTDTAIATATRWRPGHHHDPVTMTRQTLQHLARRIITLNNEITDHDRTLDTLVREIAPPRLLKRCGVGTINATKLLIAAGDNPDRLDNEASFAALCGASPVAASSGNRTRYRLNRGGDRQANSALWQITHTRLQHDPATRAYLERRTKEGLTRRDIIRCLKRYIAREIYTDLTQALT